MPSVAAMVHEVGEVDRRRFGPATLVVGDGMIDKHGAVTSRFSNVKSETYVAGRVTGLQAQNCFFARFFLHRRY